MKIIKEIIYLSYYKYNRYFPLNKGKALIAKILHNTFGSFWVRQSNKFYLQLFINSSMDLSYLDKSNDSHDITVTEINNLKPGDTFIDIGANIGYLSLIASNKVNPDGLVLSFEPSYREYKRLLANIEKNSVNNIIAYNCAVGNENSTITLQVERDHTGLNKIFSQTNIPVGNNTMINVPMFRLDYIIPHREIKLVKIDVEGAELLVLKGMEILLSKKLIHKIIVEITPKFLKEFGSKKEEIYDLLKMYNYYPTFNFDTWQYDEVFELNKTSNFSYTIKSVQQV